MNSRCSHRRRLLAALGVCGLLLTACGGDDDETSEPADAGENAAPDSSSDDAGGDVPAAGAGTATVTVDGVSHTFGRPEGVMTACTSIGGSLQVVMPEVDPTGAPIPDTELSLYLLEPDADRSLHSDPNIEIELVDERYSAGESAARLGGDAPSVELEPDGRMASGSNPVAKDFDLANVVDVEIEVQC